MALYNTKDFVATAIESILSQSLQDFEFIIVDDASTDGSYAIAEWFAAVDPRIKLHRNDVNMWIAFTRNRLIALTNTDFIAVADSDDVSLDDRLESEFAFLASHPEYSVVWGHNLIIDENGQSLSLRKYSDDIQSVILKKSPLSNPASMFRKSVFEAVGWYEPGRNLAEDYSLWVRMYASDYKIKNLDQILISLRIRSWQTKSTKIKETLRSTIEIQKNAIRNLGVKASFSDRVYIFLEEILLMFPAGFIYWLFMCINVRKWKSEF